MVGTIASLGLSTQNDLNGRPYSGRKLYIYNAGTSTPASAFKNYGLTVGQEHTFPIVADSTSLIPMFWVADGTYRARMTTSAGVVLFDEDGIVALGPSSGAGGGDTTPAASIFATGDFLWQPVSGVRAGWVRANARTIGSSMSGATERASADCENLFMYLWNTYLDTFCAVSGGRGANAAADWAANKNITTLDLRGKSLFGLDDMGNSAAGRLAGIGFNLGDAITPAAQGGAALHALTNTEVPVHSHANTLNDPGHTHPVVYQFNVASGFASFNTLHHTGSNNRNASGSITVDPATTGITINNANAGGGQAHNNMPPFVLGTYYIRL